MHSGNGHRRFSIDSSQVWIVFSNLLCLGTAIGLLSIVPRTLVSLSLTDAYFYPLRSFLAAIPPVTLVALSLVLTATLFRRMDFHLAALGSLASNRGILQWILLPLSIMEFFVVGQASLTVEGYLFTSAFFLVISPFSLSLTLRGLGWMSGTASIGLVVLAASAFAVMVPVLPQTYYNPHCNSYGVYWESISQRLAGIGYQYWTTFCISQIQPSPVMMPAA